MKKILLSVKNQINRQINAFKNSDKPEAIYPKNQMNGKIKIHFGSGEINLQGWINVDARAFEHVHIVSDKINLIQFTDGSVDEIYLCHVLEHVSFEDTDLFLQSVLKKLKNGGLLRISVPSFDSIIQIYENNNRELDSVKFALMGGQDYEYNFHKSVYNYNTLSALLESCGFTNVQTWNTKLDFGVSLGDWSDRNFSSKIGPISISLNVKATKK